jgi:diacylglycerol kinase (ATP)
VAGAQERVGLVVNPTAGGSRAGQVGRAVADALRERGVHHVDLSADCGPAAVDAVRTAVQAGAIDRLVVVGGDGMVNLAVNALVGTAVPLVIVPAGTGNDTAAALGVPLGDPLAALDLMVSGRTHTVDAARVTGADGEVRFFVGVLAGGFDAVVNERANTMRWPRGSAKYTLAALRELPVFRPIPYSISIDGAVHDTGAMLVAVANTTSYGGGMRVVPSADLADGLLDVLILGELSVPTFVRVFPTVFSGRHVSHPAVSIVRARCVELDAPGIVAYADGERIGPLPRRIEVDPGAMRIVGAMHRPAPADPRAEQG